MLLCADWPPFVGEEKESEGLSVILTYLLTFSYISFIISTYFLACSLYAFSLRISIFSSLWYATFS